MFPSPRELRKCKQRKGNHNAILLQQFKKWIDRNRIEDKVFNHHLSLFTYHGPLLQLYDDAISHNDGKARELVYQLQLPIYAPLGFRNYYQEVFRAVINFLAKWPSAKR